MTALYNPLVWARYGGTAHPPPALAPLPQATESRMHLLSGYDIGLGPRSLSSRSSLKSQSSTVNPFVPVQKTAHNAHIVEPQQMWQSVRQIVRNGSRFRRLSQCSTMSLKHVEPDVPAEAWRRSSSSSSSPSGTSCSTGSGGDAKKTVALPGASIEAQGERAAGAGD